MNFPRGRRVLWRAYCSNLFPLSVKILLWLVVPIALIVGSKLSETNVSGVIQNPIAQAQPQAQPQPVSGVIQDPMKLTVDFLQWLADKGGAVSWIVTAVIMAFFVFGTLGILTNIGIRFFFPKLRSTLLAFRGRPDEFSWFARVQFEKRIDGILPMFHRTTESEWEVTEEEMLHMANDLIHNSRSPIFHMTTLVPISEYCSSTGLVEFSGDTVKYANDNKKTLQRFLIIDDNTDFDTEFDLAKQFSLQDGIKKFVTTHVEPEKKYSKIKRCYLWMKKFVTVQNDPEEPKIRLYYLGKGTFSDYQKKHGLDVDKLDVVMFSGRLLFGLLNDNNLQTKTTGGRYTAYAIVNGDTLDRYQQFFDSLVQHCKNPAHTNSGNVIEKIRAGKLKNQYNI